jgi:hypothetical protein
VFEVEYHITIQAGLPLLPITEVHFEMNPARKA